MSQLSLRGARRTGGLRDTVAAIKTWTRDALDIGPECVVSVSELACGVPGCQPYETVVLVLRTDEATRKLSIHKPMAQVTREDVAAGWSGLPDRSAAR